MRRFPTSGPERNHPPKVACGMVNLTLEAGNEKYRKEKPILQRHPIDKNKRKQIKMSCVLRGTGTKKVVRQFSKSANAKGFDIYIKGDLINPGPKSDNRKWNFSGFGLVISNKDWGDLQGQIGDAVKYLKRKTKVLNSISKAGFKDLRLDFGICKRDDWAQYDLFPAKLIQQVGKFGMGIELSQYKMGKSKKGKVKKK